MTESQIQAEILRKCGSLPNVRLFRNTVGVGYVGRPGALTKIRFGLHVGSGDLIGWTTRRITQDDVGNIVAQFLSIEVKGPKGRLSPAQRNWFNTVQMHGGIAMITSDPELALAHLTA